MKKSLLLALTLPFAASAYASGPTKEIVEPAQGMDVAQEACTKYAGDETREVACVLFHAGVITKTNGKYALNVQLAQPVTVDANRRPGQRLKCKADLVSLPDGSIGWKGDYDCRLM